MVTAIVLIVCERGRINDVAEALSATAGITEVYSVGGQYDIVAIIRVRSNDDLARLVTESLRGVEGIARTETMVAFRSYSRHDLEKMFAIGM